MEGLREKRVILPSLERPKKLPVILSKNEVRLLLKTPKLLKHRLVIGMLYGCGPHGMAYAALNSGIYYSKTLTLIGVKSISDKEKEEKIAMCL